MDIQRFVADFSSRIADFQALCPLLDLLPDVAFFVKDRRFRVVMCNRRFMEACGVTSERDVIGKRGYEFFPARLMDLYIDQDKRVMRTGDPIVNSVCPAPEKGSNAAIVFSKIPLRDSDQRIIGVAGMYREVNGLRARSAELAQISCAIDMLHERYAEPLTVHDIATAAHLSQSQFIRQFRRLFSTTPHDYLIRIRLNAACRQLTETDQTTTAIAVAVGFFDHSHFSKIFRQFVGLNPSEYRRQHNNLSVKK